MHSWNRASDEGDGERTTKTKNTPTYLDKVRLDMEESKAVLELPVTNTG